ncbi:MAG: hypothetical protein M1167_01940, partial [Chloroflexi bacterium]|nr:hypothetical protein [Chloroflexota bacterium]
KTKIIIAIVALAAIALTIVGLASAQILANQTYTNPGTTPNPAAPNNGFWGWIGSCFGFRSNQFLGNHSANPTHPHTHVIGFPNPIAFTPTNCF